MANVRLVKDGQGGYHTPDLRFHVEPVTMGSGTTGWAGNRGWSNGHREWRLRSTDGTVLRHTETQSRRYQRLFPTLSDARDMIRVIQDREARA